jgi:hypothetical protein
MRVGDFALFQLLLQPDLAGRPQNQELASIVAQSANRINPGGMTGGCESCEQRYRVAW